MKAFRRGTKQYLIVELLESGKSRADVYNILRPMVEAQQAPMIFSYNGEDGKRHPKTLSEQLQELGYAVARIANKLQREGNYRDSEDFDFGGMEFLPPKSEDEKPEVEDEEIEDEDEDEKPKRVRKSSDVKSESYLRAFLNRIREIREFCIQREQAREAIDEVSVRPLSAAARLFQREIPAEALYAAMTLHWPRETRAEAGIEDFDFIALSKSIMEKRGIEKIVRSSGAEETPHALFGYVLTLMEARQPVMAIGPAGTGKSFLAKQAADYLGLSYAEAPMTSGASRGDLLGRHTAGGFISAQCCEKYSGGGVFNFEEIDAADSGMLIVMNNALESDELYNTISGEIHAKHPDFIPFATANTFGLGANRLYTGREKLDFSTLDRWKLGRVFMEIDPNVEEAILGLR